MMSFIRFLRLAQETVFHQSFLSVDRLILMPLAYMMMSGLFGRDFFTYMA